MPDYQSPHPWVVYRRLPDRQNLAVARFPHRHDAENYLALLQQLLTEPPFLIDFDTQDTPTPSTPPPTTRYPKRRLRHYLVGSPTATQNAIDRLYLLGYRDRSAWSHTVDIPENSLLIRPDPGDVLRYSQQRLG